MKKNILVNMGFAFAAQIVSIISGLVVPRLILSAFGSEVNGLVSSITQFLGYIALLEGGLGSVVLAALYDPLARGDQAKLDRVIGASRSLFRKISLALVVYCLIVGVGYSFVVDSSFSFDYILTLTVILGINLFSQYCFSITYRLLLQADRKVYIVNIVSIVSNIGIMLLAVLMINRCGSIHLIKLSGAVFFLIQPVFYTWYVRRNYRISEVKVNGSEEFPQRWDCFGQNLAYFVHNNTAVSILSLFANLKSVSVYSVYYLVVNSLKNLTLSVSTAYTPLMGRYLAQKDRENAENTLTQFEYVMSNVATVAFGCCISLIVPFVVVYTKGVYDVNYVEPVFAVLMSLSAYVYCIRDPYTMIIQAAGRFKQTAVGAYVEAALNIVLSLLLVRIWGLNGIAFGALASMCYRLFYQMAYIHKHIVYRSYRRFFRRLCVSAVSMVTSCTLFSGLGFGRPDTILELLWMMIVCFVLHLAVAVTANLLLDRKVTRMVFAGTGFLHTEKH